MSIAEEKINVTRNHLKNFFFFRLPLFDHPNARALLSKIKWVRRLEWTSHYAGLKMNSGAWNRSTGELFLGTQGRTIMALPQHAQWTLNEIENFQLDLHGAKEVASGAQNIFCLKS